MKKGSRMFKKIREFFTGVRIELKKVSWPSWDELKSSTSVVLVFSVIVTLFIAIVDYGVGNLVKTIIEKM